MSHLQQAKKPIEIVTQLLPSQWTLWFSYSSDQQSQVNYSNNLMQIQKVRSWAQFTLLWKWVRETEKFFINPVDGTYQKYKFGLEERKIDSINWFVDDVQPQWEFGDNKSYGYFNFGIPRDSVRTNEIFQASVFLAIGSSQQISKQILGVRLVDLSAKPTHPSRARLQLWVRFRHDNSKPSLQRLLTFQQQLQQYYKKTLNQQVNQIKFFNISNQEGQQTKTPTKTPKKEYGSKKNDGYSKGYKNQGQKYDKARD